MDNIKKIFSKIGIYLVLVIMITALSLASEPFLSVRNFLNILRQISINGIMAIGMAFILISGGIDLSFGSIIGLSGVVATSFAHPGGYPLIVSIAIGIGVGLLCGAFNGFMVAKAKITPFIVTLAMTSIARGLALIYTGGQPVSNISEAYLFIGQGYIFSIPVPIYILLIILILGFILLHHTKFGRCVYAVGGNEMAAKVSGISIQKTKFLVYVIGGSLAGLASVILSSRINSGSPNAGMGYELNAISAVVIGGTSLSGGRGTIIGALVGALIIGVLNNGLDLLNVSSYIQLVIKGFIILGAVYIDKITSKY